MWGNEDKVQSYICRTGRYGLKMSLGTILSTSVDSKFFKNETWWGKVYVHTWTKGNPMCSAGCGLWWETWRTEASRTTEALVWSSGDSRFYGLVPMHLCASGLPSNPTVSIKSIFTNWLWQPLPTPMEKQLKAHFTGLNYSVSPVGAKQLPFDRSLPCAPILLWVQAEW